MCFSLSCYHNPITNFVTVRWVTFEGTEDSAVITDPKEYQKLKELCDDQGIEVVDVYPENKVPKTILKFFNRR